MYAKPLPSFPQLTQNNKNERIEKLAINEIGTGKTIIAGEYKEIDKPGKRDLTPLANWK